MNTPREYLQEFRWRSAEELSEEWKSSTDKVSLSTSHFLDLCKIIIDSRRSVLTQLGFLPESFTDKRILDIFHRIEDGTPYPHDYQYLHWFFLLSGLLVPILLDDWEVSRSVRTVSEKLGMESFEELHHLVQERVGQQKEYVHLHLGPGDGSMMGDLTEATGKSWTHIGFGDRLYFPLESVLKRVTKKPSLSPSVAEETQHRNRLLFIQFFSRFVTREFRSRLASLSEGEGWAKDQEVVDLNEIYRILATAPEWIDKYYDRESGSYWASFEFEEDVQQTARPFIRTFFENCTPEHLREFYSDLFTEPFVADIFREHHHRNLNLCPSVRLKGFMCGKFQKLQGYFPESSVALASGFRSDSHLENEDYSKFIRDVANLLAPGAVFITDGIRQSYTRIHRFKEALSGLASAREFVKALVVMDPKSSYPRSLYLEREDKDGNFCPDKKLKKLFPGMELVPLTEIHQRFPDLIEEDACRREIYGVGQSKEIFKSINAETRSQLMALFSDHRFSRDFHETRRTVVRETLQKRRRVLRRVFRNFHRKLSPTPMNQKD